LREQKWTERKGKDNLRKKSLSRPPTTETTKRRLIVWLL